MGVKERTVRMVWREEEAEEGMEGKAEERNRTQAVGLSPP
jgi:hypothetical protein